MVHVNFAADDAATEASAAEPVNNAVDPELAEIFVLFELEDLTSPEIAALLEIPLGTVASRLRRARAEFRERVAAIEGVVPGKREDERKP